jgi:hypothetical protein
LVISGIKTLKDLMKIFFLTPVGDKLRELASSSWHLWRKGSYRNGAT